METLVENKIESIASFYEARYDQFFVQVARLVGKRGGTLDDAKDIFHDALILYYEKMMQLDFELQSSEEAYIIGIVKNLWSQKIKINLKSQSIAKTPDITIDETNIVDEHRLYKLLLSAGKKCLDLLSHFYVQQTALKDIATTLGFSSEHSASVQKYKCLEKIRETIKQNSLHHEDFLE
jgi:DNA-directed RNA polymerase specialized sigma24 family protein